MTRDERRHYGKYRGTVSDNEDPKRMGRLKAKVPEVLGDVETGWALPCAPYAGAGMGVYAVPPPDAGVWIEFEAGVVSKPLWTGCYWAEDDLPKGSEGGETTPALKVIRSEKGLMVTLDDEKQVIHVSDEDGKNVVTIKVAEGTILVKGATKAVVEAPMVELIEGATHPVVFGDSLVSFLSQVVSQFNAHTHPGQTAGPYPVTPAPPQPSLAPPQPSILSKKVKTG